MKKKNSAYIAVAALFGSAIFWGFNNPLIKIGVEQIPPAIFVALRFTAVSLILLPLALRKWRKISRRDFLLMSLASIFSVTLSSFILNIALQYTSASNAAVLSLLSPMILLLLSSRVLREKINAKTIIGTLIALFGAFIIVGGAWQTSGGGGEILVLLSLFAVAISTIIMKSVSAKVPTEQLTFMNMAPGAILMVIYVAIVPQNWDITVVTNAAWWSLVATIVCVIGANLLFFYGLKHKTAHETGIYDYVKVVVGVLAAWWLLGEQPMPLFIIGAILIAGGVYLSQLSGRGARNKT